MQLRRLVLLAATSILLGTPIARAQEYKDVGFFMYHVEGPLNRAFADAESPKPMGSSDLNEIKNRIASWKEATTGCAPGGRFERIQRLRQRCAALLSKARLMKVWLDACASDRLIDATLVGVDAWIQTFRKEKRIRTGQWTYLMDIESTITRERKELEFVFTSAGKPFPEVLAKGLRTRHAAFLRELELISTEAAREKRRPSDPTMLKAMRAGYRNARFGTLVNGVWKDSPHTVVGAWTEWEAWVKNRNDLGKLVSRSMRVSTLIQVKGEKYSRFYAGQMISGTNQCIVTQEAVGGSFRAPGNADCAATEFTPIKIR
jgi:hypothetical protein